MSIDTYDMYVYLHTLDFIGVTQLATATLYFVA